jgi:HPt (histidine-containing phosphotransfer) domain-containing protein
LTDLKPCWNREAALKSLDGDAELLVELAEIFLEGCEPLLERVGRAIDANDSTELHYAAHTLKGSIANFFAQDARDAAQALEMAGRAGHLGGAREVYQQLTGHLRCLEADLRGVQ